MSCLCLTAKEGSNFAISDVFEWVGGISQKVDPQGIYQFLPKRGSLSDYLEGCGNWTALEAFGIMEEWGFLSILFVYLFLPMNEDASDQ